MSTNLKIAIAEPSVIIRSGLENLLKRLPGFRIQMVEIHSVESLFDSLRMHKPDVLIVNPALPGYFTINTSGLYIRLFHVATFEGGKRLCRDEMYRFIIFCLRQCVIAFL